MCSYCENSCVCSDGSKINVTSDEVKEVAHCIQRRCSAFAFGTLALVIASKAGKGVTIRMHLPCASERSFRIAICTAVKIFSTEEKRISVAVYKCDLYAMGIVSPSLNVKYVKLTAPEIMRITRLVVLSRVNK